MQPDPVRSTKPPAPLSLEAIAQELEAMQGRLVWLARAVRRNAEAEKARAFGRDVARALDSRRRLG